MKILFATAMAVIFLGSCTPKVSENVADTAGATGSSTVAAGAESASQQTQSLQPASSSEAKTIKASDAPNTKQVDWSNR